MAKPWLVRCDDYTSEHRTKEAAENHKHWVEQAGRCRLPHQIIPPANGSSR